MIEPTARSSVTKNVSDEPPFSRKQRSSAPTANEKEVYAREKKYFFVVDFANTVLPGSLPNINSFLFFLGLFLFRRKSIYFSVNYALKKRKIIKKG